MNTQKVNNQSSRKRTQHIRSYVTDKNNFKKGINPDNGDRPQAWTTCSNTPTNMRSNFSNSGWKQISSAVNAHADTKCTEKLSKEEHRDDKTGLDSYSAPKLQALVCDSLPSTTAIADHTIGLEKLSADGQFVLGAQKALSL